MLVLTERMIFAQNIVLVLGLKNGRLKIVNWKNEMLKLLLNKLKKMLNGKLRGKLKEKPKKNVREYLLSW